MMCEYSHMTKAEQLGTQMKQARELARLSLRDLCDEVGISASTLGEYERGVRVPEADKLVRIAAALEHFTFQIDGFTFNISPKDALPRIPAADRQMPLNFSGEYSYSTAQVKIEPGRISVAFEGVKARLPRAAASRN
jgi:transcriptional regulator with XRE-family HTH domain